MTVEAGVARAREASDRVVAGCIRLMHAHTHTLAQTHTGRDGGTETH